MVIRAGFRHVLGAVVGLLALTACSGSPTEVRITETSVVSVPVTATVTSTSLSTVETTTTALSTVTESVVVESTVTAVSTEVSTVTEQAAVVEPAVAPVAPAAPVAPVAEPEPVPVQGLVGGSGGGAVSGPFPNCSAAKAAGAAPLYRGDPGYQSKLDRDNDGVACES